jgi:acetyl-CoA carboxylase carboxyl transferase subunit alpha
MEMSLLRVPIVSIVIGEGGSGGALALSMADRLFMLEHAIFSVISPEGCAAILWKKNGEIGSQEFSRAAEALKLTAQDLLNFRIINGIIEEPRGGAHRDQEGMAERIKETVFKTLEELSSMNPDKLLADRYEQLRLIGGLFQKEKGQ